MKTRSVPSERLPRLLLAFFGLCALLFGPWAPVERYYGPLLAAVTNGVLDVAGGDSGFLGTRAAIRLFSEPRPGAAHDIVVGVYNLDRSGPDGLGRRRVSSRHLGYLPAVLFVALVVVSPVPWRRKGRALLWGLAVIHLFIAIRIAFVILSLAHGSESYRLFEFDPPWSGLFGLAVRILAGVPATTYLVPLVVWMGFTFRAEDFESSRAVGSADGRSCPP